MAAAGSLPNESDKQPLLEKKRLEKTWSGRFALTSFDQHIPLDVSLTLSPFQKLFKYHKFPFKLVLHILVVAFASAVIICRSIQYSSFLSSSSTAIRTVLGSPYDPLVVG